MTTKWRELGRRAWTRATSTTRGRATFVTVAAAAVVLFLLVSLLLLLGRDWTENRVRATSERTVERVIYDFTPADREQVFVPREDETALIQVVNQDGEVVAAAPRLRGRPALAGADVTRARLLIDGHYCPAHLNDCVWVFGLRVRNSPWGEGVMVMAATPLPGAATMWALLASIALVTLALLALIAWWTWHTIGRVFVPVDQIRTQMADFVAHGIGHRVPVPAEASGPVRSLTEAVNATLDQLEDARVRERRFVSDASHDLRNPIAGLQMQLELALDEPDGAGWRPMVDSALRDARRLDDIVNDLLELSRLDSRAPAAVETVDLAEIARREIGRRSPRVPIEARLEPGVTVRANPVRLTRVLNNLLNNAKRHAESRVEVTVARSGADAVLEVLDDGAGVPEESRERVFERFSRLPDSRARDPQGTGLGLPIAREIAEIYGGSLRIADSPRGARFVLRLPLADKGTAT
ncbi:HAMP domain-containing histidine kinase [Actinomadura sp. GC306]|uniref:sensor histidine kinase n=1 Tax=Actinomadura sp. GC306 TaxID=2530367 RepID=UPI00104B9B5C|nr:HAMP domain-containing sensor histidine kinase [Actinomadura sp. GC306]TDC62359.1 HAMP domain-containing histidine kinase [Actinomadura sp. GC306]